MKSISRQRRDELIDALRRGTVPMQSLDLLAVGLDRFAETLLDELKTVQAGGAKFKAVRGEYGTGKTFFSRWLADRARQMAFATSEVQISETETPLHQLESVYRRLMGGLGPPTRQAVRVATSSTVGSSRSRRTFLPRGTSRRTTMSSCLSDPMP